MDKNTNRPTGNQRSAGTNRPGSPPTGSRPPVGGSRPPVGGSRPPVGGSRPPVGGSRPPVGGSRPPVGGSRPPVGGSRPPVGGSRVASGGGNPPEKPTKRRKKKKRNPFLAVIGFIFKTIGTLILIAMTTGALLACFGVAYIRTVILPETGMDLENFLVNQNSVMYLENEYGNPEEMVTLLTTTNSVWKDYHELPYELIISTVAIEDKRFWEHPGVDWRRTGAAVVYMFTGADIQGGSTITQQLIKNLTTYDDVTVKRKIIEIFRAFELDSNYSKEQIITHYLNIIYLGDGNYGVGAASWEYFGKDVSELSLAECASMISITNNPSIYSPYSTLITTDSETGIKMDGRARNKYRQELVLAALYDQGLITAQEYAASKAEELVFVRSADEAESDVIYTWYEEQVIDDVRKDLMAEYGYSSEAANRMLSSGGLSIYTVFDPAVQAVADEVYQNWKNLPVTSANGQPLQSAITIIDNRTGDIVAMVGQMGTKEQNLLRNFATSAKRQPGSVIKPLSAYAPALDMGLITPVHVFDDYAYQMEGGSPWPQNAYLSYRGMITIDYALRQSSNAAAVRVVGDLLTPEVSFDYMTNVFHLDLVEAEESNGYIMSDRGLAALALGGLTHGVTTRDMATAYATFPNDGVYTHGRTYSKVVNSAGEVILDNTPVQEVAMQSTTAYYINELLTGVISSSGTGADGQISGLTVAGKTGTTSDNYDKWFVGYSSYYTAAVWTGYEYNEKIVYSGNPALDMWKKVMQPLHSDLTNQSFSVPEGLVSVSYCLDSGLKPGSYCSSDPRGSRIASKMIHPDDAPTETCTAHVAGTSVTICTASATVDADGNSSGYRVATANCPSSTRRTTTYLSLSRVSIGGAYAADGGYVYGGQGYGYGTCTVHNGGGSGATDTGDDFLDPDSPFGDLFPSTGEDGDSSSSGSTTTTPPTTVAPLPDSSQIPGLDTSEPTTPAPTPTPTPDPEPSTPEPSTPVVPETPAPEPEPTPPTTVVPDSSMIPGVG